MKDYQNKEQDRRIYDLEGQMRGIFDHIATTNGELGQIKSDVCWLKRFFWIVATASIGGLIGILINLIITLERK